MSWRKTARSIRPRAKRPGSNGAARSVLAQNGMARAAGTVTRTVRHRVAAHGTTLS
jgi:hypothetical protein